MTGAGFADTPARASYDVVIIGGAMMGSATAFFLTEMAGFDGTVLVIERDPGYADSATARTNSCIRQQFSLDLNIRISQFTAGFIKDLRARMGGDPRVPNLTIQTFGYLYLADSQARADALRDACRVQRAAGTDTRLLSPGEIAAAYPFYATDDLVLGSLNTRDEGYWDGGALFDWFRRKARERGVDYLAGEVVDIALSAAGSRAEAVILDDGTRLACGQLVNAAGPRAAQVAGLAGLDLPVEPRKRFTWVFTAERPLDRDLPLTIDPSGIHMRQDGPQTYLAGCAPQPDTAVAPDDFAMDHAIWQDRVWPLIAARIPQFEAIRIVNEWAGHYDYNTLDQNAVIGPHDRVTNFHFINGFSGHGLQQAPAMGRGLAELLTHGAYQTLDLGAFGYGRIARHAPVVERAVI